MSEKIFLKTFQQTFNHNNYQYVDGLNIDPVPFSEKSHCGFYFTTPDKIKAYLEEDRLLMRIDLPVSHPDFKMIKDGDNYRSNMVIINMSEKFSLSIPEDTNHLHKFLRDGLLSVFAAGKSDIAGLEWLRANGMLESTSDVCMAAAHFGYLDVLKWLKLNGCSWDYRTYSEVLSNPKNSKNTKFEIIKWAYLMGCDKNNTWILCSAIHYEDNLEILKWFRQHEFPWDSSVTSEASRCNNFEALVWCIENGCPISPNICDYAIMNDNFEMLKWARSNGCEWGDQNQIYFRLHDSENEEMFEWVVKNGCKWANIDFYLVRSSFWSWTDESYEKTIKRVEKYKSLTPTGFLM